MASEGVATRAWSFRDALAGRTPGTTMRKFGPHARRMACASCEEATTPSSCACLARRARESAREAGDPEIPTRRSEALSMLVNIVTPRSKGGRLLAATASLAARIMARSPSVCRVSMRTLGKSAAAATALPTVVGISWNFRSRNIPGPRLAILSTARGPSAVNNWLPTLNKPTAPRSRRAKSRAGPRRSKSSATISCDDPGTGVMAPSAAQGEP